MLYQKIKKSKIPAYLIELPQRAASLPVEIYFPAGYFHAPQDKQEVSHLLEHYLFKSLFAVDRKMEIDAFTNVRFISLSVQLPKKNFFVKLRSFLKVMLDNPLNDEGFFNNERKILLNELTGILDDPYDLAHRLAINSLTPDQPPFTVSMEDYKTITLADVADFYRTRCQSTQPRLFIGVHQPDQAWKDELNQVLAAVPATATKKKSSSPSVKKIAPAKLAIIKHPLAKGRIQLDLTWAMPNLSDSAERLAMLFILDLLNETDDGLVWHELREQSGLIYDLDGLVDYYPAFGFFSLSVAVLPEDLTTSLSIVLDQVERIKTKDYPNRLFKKLHRDYVQVNKKNWGKNFSRFNWIKSDLLDEIKAYDLEEWLKVLGKIDQSYLAETAKKYLLNQKLHLVLVGDKGNNIRPDVLKKIAERYI